MLIKINDDHIDVLRENKYYLDTKGDFARPWLLRHKLYNAAGVVSAERYAAQLKPGVLSSLGAFSYTRSALPLGVTVGRYCSISGGVNVMGSQHPSSRIACGGFDYSRNAPFGLYLTDKGIRIPITPLPRELNQLSITIADDVWIGEGVLLARTVRVGQGAMIAARSIVTHDVPPYAIVAGSPAVVKKYRFEPELIARLLASKWTDFAFDSFSGMDTAQPNAFLDAFERRLDAGEILPLQRSYIDLHDMLRKVGPGSAVDVDAASLPVVGLIAAKHPKSVALGRQIKTSVKKSKKSQSSAMARVRRSVLASPGYSLIKATGLTRVAKGCLSFGKRIFASLSGER